MKNEIFIKDIPSYIVYYHDGIIEDLSKITEFVLETDLECAEANHGLKCVTSEYCYVSYLDGEYKERINETCIFMTEKCKLNIYL